jgi:hypothetical protein
MGCPPAPPLLAPQLANNKRVIPILIEPIDLETIPYELRALQFIDFLGHQDEDNYYISVNKLFSHLA